MNQPAVLNAAEAKTRLAACADQVRALGVVRLAVFGSVLRGEASPASDVDLLVEFEPGRSLLDHAALQIELEALLGRRVDVASERGLRPRVRERVLREARPL